jgi:hypothetical protein
VEERTDALHTLHRRVFGTDGGATPGRPRPGVDERGARAWAPCSFTSGDLRARASRGRIRRVTLDLLDSTGPGGYTSASEADAAVAAGLIRAGLTADEALALLLASARGQDAMERKGQRHGLAYLQRTVARAADYVGPVIEPAQGRLRLVRH